MVTTTLYSGYFELREVDAGLPRGQGGALCFGRLMGCGFYGWAGVAIRRLGSCSAYSDQPRSGLQVILCQGSIGVTTTLIISVLDYVFEGVFFLLLINICICLSKKQVKKKKELLTFPKFHSKFLLFDQGQLTQVAWPGSTVQTGPCFAALGSA